MTGLEYDPSSPSKTTCSYDQPFSSSLESTSTSASSSLAWSGASSQSSANTSPVSSSEWDSCGPVTTARPSVPCRKEPPSDANSWVKHTARQASAIPAGRRQNPRRSAGDATRCPPSLVRQSDRKNNFVDNLVDSSTQIVETIWPLSSVICRNDAGSKTVLPLRTFIQETLRRSRTSYSTLQVALYYLVLIKPHVPKYDFTMEQPDDRHECRALQCGRRMFLAALILASKYLQDRNYSARAWSKISGLATQEINQNELTFLLAVDWKLHITDEVFQRWTKIVLKYTPPSPPSPGASASPLYLQQSANWRSLIVLLNPELDNIGGLIPMASAHAQMQEPLGFSPRKPASTRREYCLGDDTNGEALDMTPTPKSYATPSIMEPVPSSIYMPGRRAPALGLLPTPRLTPQSSGCDTPAASAAPHAFGRGSSMGFAMAQATSASSAQTMDRWPPALTSSPREHTRRSSLAHSISSASSPESMVSDTSRTSRSSSISSASSLASAPTQKMGIAARLRCARLGNDRPSSRPVITSVPEGYFADSCLSSSPDSYTGPTGKLGDLSLETPLARRERELEESEAASALQALQSQQSISRSMLNGTLSRKRSYPEAMGYPSLQSNVRGMLSRTQSAWPESLVRQRAGMVSNQPNSSDASPRKRLCYSDEAEGLGDVHHSSGAYRGPGMWEGILN